jgi:flavin reductase (DIM6/NTAB) family NADH-FMN oxidoreductase RutF
MQVLMQDLSPMERYKYLTALVVPRPIALVLTRNAAGQDNAAPFSFFNTFGEDPPTVILGLGSLRSGAKKDTLRNIEQTGEFVVNLVDSPMLEAVNMCASDFPYGESEVSAAGLNLLPCQTVNVGRVAESPANFECKVLQTIELNSSRTLVIGEVIFMHLKEELVDRASGRVITERYTPLARLHGTTYGVIGEQFSRAIAKYPLPEGSGVDG